MLPFESVMIAMHTSSVSVIKIKKRARPKSCALYIAGWEARIALTHPSFFKEQINALHDDDVVLILKYTSSILLLTDVWK